MSAPAPALTRTSDQLKNLFDYTKFHIGLYSGLIATVLALLKFGRDATAIKGAGGYLHVTVLCFLIAGICGGVLASSVCEFSDFDTFKDAGLGFWGLENIFPLKYRFWSRLEHTAFWIGIFSAVVGFW